MHINALECPNLTYLYMIAHMTLYRNDVTKIALSRANVKLFFLLKKAARCCHHGLDPTYCSLEFDLPMIEVDMKYSGSNCGRYTFSSCQFWFCVAQKFCIIMVRYAVLKPMP